MGGVWELGAECVGESYSIVAAKSVNHGEMRMPEYRDSRERSEGANQILDYCGQIAEEMSVNLKDVSWVTDITETHARYTLSIDVESGTKEVFLTPNELEDFPGGGGLAVTEAKIRSALRARLTLPKK